MPATPSPHPPPRAEPVRGRRILVTGGCGFIGSHLVQRLLDAGAARVIVLDSLRYGDLANVAQGRARPSPHPEGEAAGSSGTPGDRVEIVRFTLGSDARSVLEQALDGVDLLFHLAAEKHNQSKDDPRRVFRANVEGMHELLDVACDAGVRKVVFTSSLYAYGRTSGPDFAETEIPQPTTIYGISKLCGEHLCAHFARERGLAWNAIRYLFVYGPKQFAGMGYKSVIVKNFERLLDGLPVVVRGDGEQSLDYVFVDDAVEATLATMELPFVGEVLNVGSGASISVNQLLSTMRQVAGIDPGIEHEPADWTAGSRRVGNVAKARRLLGLTPRVSLEEGLRRTHDWMRAMRAGAGT